MYWDACAAQFRSTHPDIYRKEGNTKRNPLRQTFTHPVTGAKYRGRAENCPWEGVPPKPTVYIPLPAKSIRWVRAAQEAVATSVRSSNAPFRAELIRQYGERCVITDAETYLDAAHIRPVKLFADWDTDVNLAGNGLMLRKDIHWAFDNGYWSALPNGHVVWRAGYVFPDRFARTTLSMTDAQRLNMAGHYDWWLSQQ
jgi:hypothetical protein